MKFFAKYFDFSDIFSLDLTSELSKHIRINNHFIKLITGQQLPYRAIYSLELVEMETLKDYVKINLANRFIWQFKLLVDTLIFFDQKSDAFFWLYVDYKGLNNLIINNFPFLILV